MGVSNIRYCDLLEKLGYTKEEQMRDLINVCFKGGETMTRHNLYVFRHKCGLTQAEMAEKCGVSRLTYSFIENGKRSGKYEFWRNLQQVFNVPDEKIFLLQKVEERKEQCETKERL